MVNYGLSESFIKPANVRFDSESVWVATDIEQVSIIDDDDNPRDVWRYNLRRYTKDEYITIQAEQITEIQLALVELGGV